MPRKNLLRVSGTPYHIVSRSNHKTWFTIELSKVWSIAINSLVTAHHEYPVNIHAFVLMSNHYHLVVETPNCDIDKFMYVFNKNFSLSLREATNLVNRMFGGRYKWSVINNRQHYFQVMKYVYRNPVKANMVQRVEDFPFSTIARELNFPLEVHDYFDDFNVLDWYNSAHHYNENFVIEKGLRKSVFKYGLLPDNRSHLKFTHLTL